MKIKTLKYLLLTVVLLSLSCSNWKTKGEEKIIKKYYYKDVTKYYSEPEDEYLNSYITIEVYFVKDSIFTVETYFNDDFEIRNKQKYAFLRKGGELYSVQSNGTRLYLSIETEEPVAYFRDPYFEITNATEGKIHWYLGTDTIQQKELKHDIIRHKFLVKIGLPYLEEELHDFLLERDSYLKHELTYYYYYDEDFILISTEYAGWLNGYQERYRIHPFFDSNNPGKE